MFFPDRYQTQLDEKVDRLTALLPKSEPMTVFASLPANYRARAEFRVWHEGDRTDYIMFDPDTKEKVAIESCPMALESIANLMPRLMTEIVRQPALRTKLFQVDFLATLSGEMLVTLIYRRPLQQKTGIRRKLTRPGWKRRKPAQNLTDYAYHWPGAQTKSVFGSGLRYRRLQVDEQSFVYQQVENSFTQPNAEMAQNMLHWARKMAALANPDQSKDLIELYCGNGHFSIALASHFNQVLATEISKTSVASAEFNIDANRTDNVRVVKMAAEEISAALEGQRAFFRLKDVDLKSYDFNTIFVDPPRSGLDDLTRKMVTEFEHILYISCNPETLARDLADIGRTHDVVETALFDQFPYTHHIESGVYLKRKAK